MRGHYDCGTSMQFSEKTATAQFLQKPKIADITSRCTRKKTLSSQNMMTETERDNVLMRRRNDDGRHSDYRFCSHANYTVSKKRPPFIFAITLSKINRF